MVFGTRSRSAIAISFALLAVPAVGSGQSPTPAATPRPACPSPHGGVCVGPLAAGTYITVAFATPLTFTVSEGWANFEDLRGNFLLIPPGSSNDDVDAGMSDYLSVYQGAAVAEGTCAGGAEPGIGRTAAAMAEAFRARPGILVTEPVPVEVGGLTGLLIDITMDPDSDASCTVPDFPGRLVPLIVGAGPAELDHAQIDGITTRLYLLDHGTSNVVIEVSDVAASAGRIEEAGAIIDSFVFDVG